MPKRRRATTGRNRRPHEEAPARRPDHRRAAGRLLESRPGSRAGVRQQNGPPRQGRTASSRRPGGSRSPDTPAWRLQRGSPSQERPATGPSRSPSYDRPASTGRPRPCGGSWDVECRGSSGPWREALRDAETRRRGDAEKSAAGSCRPRSSSDSSHRRPKKKARLASVQPPSLARSTWATAAPSHGKPP